MPGTRWGCLLGGIAVALAISGCAHKKRVAAPPPPPAHLPAVGDTETGVARWYGHPYHGRPAANGEIYDMEKLTAAHRTLPFDAWVRVVNLNNDKSVEVRIIDRGPFVDGRVIDLSHAAAREINLIGPGTAPVRIVVTRMPPAVAPGVYAIQVGAFRERSNAERSRRQMTARYGAARIALRAGNPDMWRVLVGAEATPEGAAALAERIRQDSGEKTGGLIVRIDSM
ncbi:MAG: septal ring lytic transglycosylase RlpA family protein [Acidobacteriia bacterium]|nr:septal ring lytic transglycosylase RlpA family protein [Terriglobia bacterium]